MPPQLPDRHFACLACGKCCDRGPEMELGEAAALADIFITRLMFRVHSFPRSAKGLVPWWRHQRSSLPARAALTEARQHVAHFSAHDDIDKLNDRTLHLTASAISVHVAQACPALEGEKCGIYERRPHSCRTVPLHHSRPSSTAAGYLDRFVQTPGYRCNTGPEAPLAVRAGTIADPAMITARSYAIAQADADKPWRKEIAGLTMNSQAGRAGLPTYETVIRNSDAGRATTVSMLMAWRIGLRLGSLTRGQFDEACRNQVALLRPQVRQAGGDPQTNMFADMLSDYQSSAATPITMRTA